MLSIEEKRRRGKILGYTSEEDSVSNNNRKLQVTTGMDIEKVVVRLEVDASEYIKSINAAEKAVRAISEVRVKDCTSPKKPKPLYNRHRKVGRNERCPCGSGKKFKNCHLPLGLHLVPVGN